MRSQILSFVRLSLFPLRCPSALCSRTRKIPLYSSISNRVYSQYNIMPKKDKTSKSNPKAPETPPGLVTKVKDGTITIAIHAKPGAKQKAITDVSEEAVGVADRRRGQRRAAAIFIQSPGAEEE